MVIRQLRIQISKLRNSGGLRNIQAIRMRGEYEVEPFPPFEIFGISRERNRRVRRNADVAMRMHWIMSTPMISENNMEVRHNKEGYSMEHRLKMIVTRLSTHRWEASLMKSEISQNSQIW